jgi:hypothetical protein
MDAQKAVWALVGDVRNRLRSGLVPDGGFALGFVDGLSTMDPVPHAVIHVVPLRKDAVDLSLPDRSEWIHDDGYTMYR